MRKSFPAIPARPACAIWNGRSRRSAAAWPRRSPRQDKKTSINAEDLTEYLGPVRFSSEAKARMSTPGVAMGLAWTPVGGDLLFIEATA